MSAFSATQLRAIKAPAAASRAAGPSPSDVVRSLRSQAGAAGDLPFDIGLPEQHRLPGSLALLAIAGMSGALWLGICLVAAAVF